MNCLLQDSEPGLAEAVQEVHSTINENDYQSNHHPSNMKMGFFVLTNL